MEQGPLAGLQVVEWTCDVPGSYCGKLLADMGAETIKVEEPEGDPVRRMGPFVGDDPDPERSGLFLYLNSNKLGITLELRSEAGRRVFKHILGQADIFVTDATPGALDERGIEYESLASDCPKLIFTHITPFGLTGPRKDHKITDLVAFQMSGLGHATPTGVENPEVEPPLRPRGRQADFVAGLTAAVATLHGVFTRYATGRGQLVDVSRQEAATAFNIANVATYASTGKVPVRHKSARSGPPVLLPCSDGWVAMMVGTEPQWKAFMEVLGSPEWSSWEIFRDRTTRAENFDAVTELLSQETRRFGKDELGAACQAKRVPVQAVSTVPEMMGSPQLSARGFFVEMDHPVAGKVILPGNPLLFSGQRPGAGRPAPLFGQHTEMVLRERLGRTEEEVATTVT